MLPGQAFDAGGLGDGELDRADTGRAGLPAADGDGRVAERDAQVSAADVVLAVAAVVIAAADGGVREGSVAAQVVADRCLPHLRQGGDEQVFCKELSDVLLQVSFHAWIVAARADGAGYTINGVATGLRPSGGGIHACSRAWPSPGRTRSTGAGTRSSGEEKKERAERAGLLLFLMDRRPGWTGCRSASLALALATQLQRRAARGPGAGGAGAPGRRSAAGGYR
jgi:hypothetical protein